MGMKSRREIILNLKTDPTYIALVIAFMEHAAQAQGLAPREAMSLTLAAEELFACFCRLFGPENDLEIRCIKGGYYVQADFITTAGELNLRAFNLTSSVSPEDEASLEELGLLLASRSVDRFTLIRDRQRVVLSLIKEKFYPEYEKKGMTAPQPVGLYDLITPDPSEVKWFAQLIGEHVSTAEVPAVLQSPGKLVDIVESNEFQVILAKGRSGEIIGGMIWGWASEKTAEFFGPYLFPSGSNPKLAQALIDSCLTALARTRAVGLINRRPVSDLPRQFFETLGCLTCTDPDGKKREDVHYFRQIAEDPGSTIWVVPEIESFLQKECRRLVLPRSFRPMEHFGESLPAFSVLSTALDRIRKTVTLRPVVAGQDIGENIRQHRHLFRKEQIKNIFVELDVGQFWQADFAAPLVQNEFLPRIIIPYGGIGDLLIFQGKAD
jgi:hypothetical protein